MLPDDYAARAERYQSEADAARWAAALGLEPPPPPGEIEGRYADLFDRATVERLLGSADEQPLAALAALAVDGYLARALAVAEAAVARAERAAEVTLDDGEVLDLPAARARLLNDPHPRRRRSLADALAEAERAVNGARLDHRRAYADAVGELGFDEPARLIERLTGVELDALLRVGEALIEATDDVYRRGLRAGLARLGLAPEDAHIEDLIFLLRAPQLDARFPASGLVPALRSTLARLGLALDELPGLALVTDPHPGAGQSALVAPVQVPADVRLALLPAVGYNAYRAACEALGEALHFAGVDPALPFTVRRLGDLALPLAHGRLFGEWLRSPRWLRDELGIRSGEARDYLPLAHLAKLYRVRREVALLRYEAELDPADADVPALFVEIFTGIMGVRHRPAAYLLAVTRPFAAVAALRGTIYEAHLRRWLEATLGDNWFQRPEGGRELRARWARGQSAGVEAAARALGAAGLDAAPLIEDLIEPRD